MWRFVLNITTHEPSLLEIPLKRPPPPKPVSPPPQHTDHRLLWGIAGVVLLALMVGAGIYVYVAYLLKRQMETRTVQREIRSNTGG